MFYLFHHMPKCGGTSFRNFLQSVFTVHGDYVGTDPQTDPEKFAEFSKKRLNLSQMTEQDCVAGHYNVSGIHLHERYPELERLPHRKFCILRDPFEAAKSGVRYNVKRGLLPKGEMPSDFDMKFLNVQMLRRANYYSRVFGLRSEDDFPALFARYWFIAPLDRLDQAVRMIEQETGRRGKRPGLLNATRPWQEDFAPELEEEFRERAWLDYRLYDMACLHFGGVAARSLLPSSDAAQGMCTAS